MFGFDERFAMFDITPVENQFILEYLPQAKGEYVKVYLYGLMRCYHPDEDVSLDRMSHELNMTEDDITAAFRYWERRGAVRRISDQPPKWQYINIKQKNLSGDDEGCDPEYEEFSNAVYESFDRVRRLHGSELNTCFEWKEELNLPTEVIIMLLNHMVEIKGKNFRMTEADKVAARMAEENIQTVEDAEDFFLRDGRAYSGIRKILRMLGKKYLPTEAQVHLYKKWTDEWRFSPEAIEVAVELTAKGDPSLGYLDGILNGLRANQTDEGTVITAEAVRYSSMKADGLKTVLSELGRGEINQRNLALYDQMTALFPQEVILSAAHECAAGGKNMEDVLKLLQSWKEKGLETSADVEEYIQAFRRQTTFIRELRKTWGSDDGRISKTDRSLVSKWEKDLGFSREMIMTAAGFATEAKQPMAYLDQILMNYRKDGITTPEMAVMEHEKIKTSRKTRDRKILPAQDFAQRDYSDVQNEMEQDLAREMEAYMRKNGGMPDA